MPWFDRPDGYERIQARAKQLEAERALAKELGLTHSELVLLDSLADGEGFYVGAAVKSLISGGYLVENERGIEITKEGRELVRRARWRGL